MRKNILITIVMFLMSFGLFAQEYIFPYYEVGVVNTDMKTTYNDVVSALKSKNFQILGTYHPAKKKSLQVIVFTRGDLKSTLAKVTDRGMLGAAQKVGLQQKNGKVHISYTNPDYMLRAYVRDEYPKYKLVFDKFHADLKDALSAVGNQFTPFGGKQKASKLKKYHYKMMMPYFTDPIELKKFNSFDEGYQIILNNLKNRKEGMQLVYKISNPATQTAVFGIGLNTNWTDCEAFFLPRIGEDNIAALPYEIILQGNTVTMLHGKYRFALFWPELSMGQFMKIMSTPGKIEKRLRKVCE